MSSGRGKGSYNWFERCAPCFKPEQDSMRSRSSSSTGDGGENPSSLSLSRAGGEGGDEILAAAASSSSSIIAGLMVCDNDNPELWKYFDLGRHGSKDYSWSIVKSQPKRSRLCNIRVEKLPEGGIFVGLYDAHGSSHLCSIYAHENLITNLFDVNLTGNAKGTIEDDLRQAFLITDEKWLQVVFKKFREDRLIAAAGTSSLVGIIGGRGVYLANAGDSRALIGAIDENSSIIPYPLTKEDNVNDPTVRAELLIDHPEPDFITKNSAGVYTIKGQSQISKSIGDGFLKRSDFNLDDIPEYKLNSPLTTSALSATPFTGTTYIDKSQKFLVFASKELWDIIPNSEVVAVIQMYPRKGIAATLIRYALKRVATMHNITYSELQNANDGGNIYYKDISVAVVFFEETRTVKMIEEEAQQGAVTENASSSTATDKVTGFKVLEDEDFDDDMPGLEDVPPAALP